MLLDGHFYTWPILIKKFQPVGQLVVGSLRLETGPLRLAAEGDADVGPVEDLRSQPRFRVGFVTLPFGDWSDLGRRLEMRPGIDCCF
jgi:hypothetical protein